MNALVGNVSLPWRIVRVPVWTASLLLCVVPIPAGLGDDHESAAVEADSPGGASLEQLFPDELKYWPDLKRVDRVLNRKPFQTFTSFNSIAWLDGSQTIMCGDRAGFAIWDVATGRLKQRLPTEAWNGGDVRGSRDGKRLLTTGDYTDTQIVQWPSLEVTQTIQAHALGPRSHGVLSRVRLSPDGRYAAMIVGASINSYLRIFDCDTGRMILHQEIVRSISSLAWDPQNRFLVVGEGRGTVIFINFRGELLRRGIRLDVPEAPRFLAVSPEGERLAIGTRHSLGLYAIHGRRKLWELGPKDLKRYDKIMNVRFSADGRELIGLRDSYPPQTSLVAWDANSGVERRSRAIGTYYTTMLEVSPDGRLIASEGHDNTLVLCDAKTFEPLVANEPAGNPDIINNHNFPRGVFPSPDGQRLLHTGWTNVTMWDVDTSRQMWTESRPDPVHAAAWNSTGQWFAIVRGGTYDHEVGPAGLEILNAGDGRLLWQYPLEDSNGAAAHVLSDDRIVVCTQHHAQLFDSSGRQLWQTKLSTGIRSAAVCVSPDENQLAIVRREKKPGASYPYGHMLLLETETGRLIRELRGLATPVQPSFSADGKRLFASVISPQRRGSVQILLEEWDVATGRRVNNPNIPDDPKHGVDYFAESSAQPLQPILDRWPLLASRYRGAFGRMAVSADHRWLAIEKPFDEDEREERGIPRWSKRLLFWDMEREVALGELVVPGWLSHIAIFPDGRLAVLNSNDTIFVVQQPDFATEEAQQPRRIVAFHRAEDKPADGLIEKTIDGTEQKVYLHPDADVSDRHIAQASLRNDALGQVAIEIEFTDEGTQKMEAVTVAHAKKRLAIVVNGKVISAPIIQSKVSSKALLTGNFTQAEAQRIVDALAKERDDPEGGNGDPDGDPMPSDKADSTPRPAASDDASQTGSISGQLATAGGEAIRLAGATVFLCDAKTGYPIVAATKKPLGQSVVDGIDKLWLGTTDENGRFEFNEVPFGLYRLVAQTWPDINQIPTAQGDASTLVRLHGVAENIRVDGDHPANAVLKQLGDGVLTIRNDPEEAHAFLFLSPAAMIGDPILGPVGWGERFIAEAIGITLMEETFVTIEGLPDGKDLHVALFNYDNNPGIGGGTFRVGRQREVRLEILASWSNGKHDPPPRLLKLVEYFEAHDLSLSALIGLEKTDSHNRKELHRIATENPERVIEVEGLGEFRFIDVLAASSYKYLRDSHRARHAR